MLKVRLMGTKNDIDMSKWEVHTASELLATVQAEQLINRMEFHRSVYDTNERNYIVEDRETQLANITEDIRSGNIGYLNDFLNALISDSIREGMADIFGKGTELDDSDGVQTARKAKELLDKLAEYKPLAKIEELEECNYNMIDNVLNNEKPKEEKQTGRVFIKEKLAEKKRRSSSRGIRQKEKFRKRERRKNQRGRYRLWINLQWKKSI